LTALPATETEPPPVIPGATKARCLILACGNSLRKDDGVGLRIAEWAEERFQENLDVRVLARQQFTPELAADIAAAESVIFVDSSVELQAGRVDFFPAQLQPSNNDGASHHLDANGLLELAQELYGSRPAHAMLLAVGAGSMELGETLSNEVEAALPRAQGVLEKAALTLLDN
jgi:hydrogenase maturation protease